MTGATPDGDRLHPRAGRSNPGDGSRRQTHPPAVLEWVHKREAPVSPPAGSYRYPACGQCLKGGSPLCADSDCVRNMGVQAND